MKLKLVILLVFLFSFFGSKADPHLRLPPIQIVIMEETNYTEAAAVDLVREAVKVFEVCGVSSEVDIKVNKKTKGGINGSIFIFDLESPFSILHEYPTHSNLSKINIFLVTDFIDKNYSAGLSIATWTDFEINPMKLEMANSVWIATNALSKVKYEYNTLSHELAHVLTKEAQHNGIAIPNILSIAATRNNFLLDTQCESIRKNPLVSPK